MFERFRCRNALRLLMALHKVAIEGGSYIVPMMDWAEVCVEIAHKSPSLLSFPFPRKRALERSAGASTREFRDLSAVAPRSKSRVTPRSDPSGNRTKLFLGLNRLQRSGRAPAGAAATGLRSRICACAAQPRPVTAERERTGAAETRLRVTLHACPSPASQLADCAFRCYDRSSASLRRATLDTTILAKRPRYKKGLGGSRIIK